MQISSDLPWKVNLPAGKVFLFDLSCSLRTVPDICMERATCGSKAPIISRIVEVNMPQPRSHYRVHAVKMMDSSTIDVTYRSLGRRD
jgi:hypothetical protein